MNLEDIKNIADASQGFFTSAAIVIGGVWTYFIFVKNRSRYPIINLNISYEKFDILNDKFLIHVSVKLENHGLVLLQSEEAELRLRQVTPLPEEVLGNINKGYDPIPEEKQEVLWPLLFERRWNWSDNSFEIEPKESDILHADFVVDNEVEIMEFYFYLKNSVKSKKQLGWALTTMSYLSSKEIKMTEKKPTSSSIINEQQTVQVRQQKQQTVQVRQQKPQVKQKPKRKPKGR